MTRHLMVSLVLLLLTAGCAARGDWIESTLVTVDVTGRWTGWAEGATSFAVDLVLEQRGPKVEGWIRVHTRDQSAVQGTVDGDVLRFAETLGPVKGEATVAGDDMRGDLLGSQAGGRSKVLLRRVDRSGGSAPPKQERRAP